MVSGKPSVPRRPTNSDKSKAGGSLDAFLSSLISLFFLPLSGRRPYID